MEFQTFNIAFLICLLICSGTHFVASQGNSLTFSPSIPRCIGEELEMICFVVPPTAQLFDSSSARLSFNGSVAPGFASITGNIVPGVDTSRYSPDVIGLTINSSRAGARLTISNFQASDAATNFSCHGLYAGDVFSYALISGSPQFAEPVTLTFLTLTVESNITQDSSIYTSILLDLSTVDRIDTLLYTSTLHIDGAVAETLNSLTPTAAVSTPFNAAFTLDNYYHISVTAVNCVGGGGNVDSKTFVLLRLQLENGEFMTSSSNSSRIEWIYSNLDTSYGAFEQDYLSKDFFTFTIDNESITEFSLYLPHRFDFALPPGYDQSVRAGMLNISFNGIMLGGAKVIVKGNIDNTLTTILAVLGGLLFILLIVIVCITAVFVVIYIKKRKSP